MKANRTFAAFLAAPAALPLLLLALAFLTAHPARGAADPARTELKETAVSVSALQPGKPAMAAVVFEIKPGFHSHSNTPSQPYYIKFRATVKDNPAVKVGEVVYPKGEDHEYPAIGKLNVYTGKVVVRFPVEAKPDAKPGPVKLTGELRFQVCDDKVCYPPAKAQFEIATKIAGADEKVTPNRPDLFPGAGAATRPAATPATAPAKRAPPKSTHDRTRADIEGTSIDPQTLEPGKPATASVVLNIKPSFHAQSNKPLDPRFNPVRFKVLLDPHPSLQFGEPQFPEPLVMEFGGEKLSVFKDRLEVRIPVEAKSGAAPGPVTISGKLSYQICDERTNVCFPPEKAAFEIDAVIAEGTGAPAVARGGANDSVPPAAVVPPAPVPPGTSSGPGDAAAVLPPPAEKANTVLGFELKPDALLLPFAAAFLVGIIFNIMPCVLPVVPLKAMGFYEVSQHNRARSLAFGAVFSAGLIASFAALGLLIFVLQALDWGGLFRNFYFRLAIVLILLAMAVGTFGAFNVNLPNAVYGFSPRHDTYFGNFLYGILTAALSTPCTFGMFVALLAWASTRPAGVGMALLTMVGVGMAFPYFVLSAFPEVARRFPRSGPWAETVKKFMAFLLLAMALYFAKPFVEELVRPSTFWWLLFAVIVAAGLLLVVRTFRYARTAWGPAVGVAVALLLVVPSFFVIRQLAVQRYQWVPYSDQALAEARRNERVTLVEFTADWCGNCHWLEAKVLNSDEVVKAVASRDVAMLKADVTDVDAEELEARKLLNRYSPKASIPLTLIYSPNLSEPIQLTGIYSRQDLINAIERAASAEPELASQQ